MRARDVGDTAQRPFVPYIAGSEAPREWTLRAVLVGVVMAFIFNAANAYVGLKIGLTVSASIPSAVISMALFRRALPWFSRTVLRRASASGTILENNIAHTFASTGESLAAGIIFTLPAFYFLSRSASGHDSVARGLPGTWDSFVYGTLGGLLGILAMIPLRHFLTVKEHAVLPYPEGVACAKVLIAGDQGGVQARPVFLGILTGALGRVLIDGVGIWKSTVWQVWPRFHKLSLGIETTPLLIGVGYLIGAQVAGIMLAGGVLAHFVLIPLIDWAAQHAPMAMAPSLVPVVNMDAFAIRGAYIKYIGAGGVAFGGLVSLLRAAPALLGLARTRRALRDQATSDDRLERDIPARWIIIGLALIALGLVALPTFRSPRWGLGTTLLLVLAAFGLAAFFISVAARTVGLVGSTSQPVSGMTLTAVLGSALLLAALGQSGLDARYAAMAIGAVVCIAVSLAGDLSQDLKTGALIGATPKYVQYAEMLGVVTASLRAGAILAVLHAAYGLGSPQLAAPQADLMAKIVEGVLGGQLEWTLLAFGAGIGLAAELCGVSALAFSIGLYLPVSTWTAVFVGGLLASYTARRSGGTTNDTYERGTLCASGYVAGDALAGIALAMLAVGLEQFAGTRAGELLPLLSLDAVWGPLANIMPPFGMLVFVWIFTRIARI